MQKDKSPGSWSSPHTTGAPLPSEGQKLREQSSHTQKAKSLGAKLPYRQN
jgi:hypothetical protein